MEVKKLDNIIFIVVDELRDVNDEMIDDIARMNKGMDVAVYYKEDKRLVLLGDVAIDGYHDLVAQMESYEKED